MKDTSLLFLDFDGVVCDSLPETLVSSWLGYHRYIKSDMPVEMPVDFRTKFLALRPFIRSGEDYIVLQKLIEANQNIKSQADLDAIIAAEGPEQMAWYKEIFYQARTELLTNDRTSWLSLNPLFDHMESALRARAGNRHLYILSTKKKEFIAEIFLGNSIRFPGENIIYSGSESKQGIISEKLDKTGAQKAVFIDDQISHLLDVRDERIDVRLASWGYIQSEWLSMQNNVSVVSEEETVTMIQSL